MKRIITIAAIALCASLPLAALYGCSSGGGMRNEAAMPQAAPPMPSTTANSARGYISAAEDAIAEDEAEMGGYADEYDYALEYDAGTASSAASSAPFTGETAQSINTGNRKIVYTADISLQTKEFESGVALVEDMTARYNGFIQSSQIQGNNLYDYSGRQNPRRASYTVRIPENRMRDFLSELEDNFNMDYSNIYSDDITGTYFDTKARLESLKIQRERLMEMLENAQEVKYLIEVQRELSRVEYEIESLTSSMNRMDDAVSFSTLNLSIEEVVEYTAAQPIHATFGEQISGTFHSAWTGFVSFCQRFVLILVALTPYLIIIVPILVIVVVLAVRRGRAGKAARQQAPAPPKDDVQK